jgi:hypothetical protein
MAGNLPAVLSRQDIHALQVSGDNAYWDPRVQERERVLIAEELQPRNKVSKAVAEIENALPESDYLDLSSTIYDLSEPVRDAISAELADGKVLMPDYPTWDQFNDFQRTEAGAALARDWSVDWEAKLAQVEARTERLSMRMTAGEFDTVKQWFHSLGVEQQVAILKVLAK